MNFDASQFSWIVLAISIVAMNIFVYIFISQMYQDKI